MLYSHNPEQEEQHQSLEKEEVLFQNFLLLFGELNILKCLFKQNFKMYIPNIFVICIFFYKFSTSKREIH